MAHGGPQCGDGPPEGHCALGAMGRIGPEIGYRARRLGSKRGPRAFGRLTLFVAGTKNQASWLIGIFYRLFVIAGTN